MTMSARCRITFPQGQPSWPQVKLVLQELCNPSERLDDAFRKLCRLHSAKHPDGKARNPPLKSTPFEGLKRYFEANADEDEGRNFAYLVLPNIAKLALKLRVPKEPRGLYISEQQIDESVTLGRKFVAGLVATGFLGLFPEEQERDAHYHCISDKSFNFSTIYAHIAEPPQRAKLRCLLNYFYRLALAENRLPGFITFRRVVAPSLTMTELMYSTTPLCPLVIQHNGKIEDSGSKVLQVDFSHKCIGGGVLSLGNSQEEIRFSTCPELLASILFMDSLASNEAIVIQGFEQFSQYRGYGSTFKFAGDIIDMSPRDDQGSILTSLTAIDAVSYQSVQWVQQYLEKNVIRDVNKAYAGFSQPYVQPHKRLVNKQRAEQNIGVRADHTWMFEMDPEGMRPIATGNWGCGTCQGDMQLKLLLQWLAASYADCPGMIYYTDNKVPLLYMADLATLIGQSCDTVGGLTRVLQVVCAKMFRGLSMSPGRNLTVFDELWRELEADGGIWL